MVTSTCCHWRCFDWHPNNCYCQTEIGTQHFSQLWLIDWLMWPMLAVVKRYTGTRYASQCKPDSRLVSTQRMQLKTAFTHCLTASCIWCSLPSFTWRACQTSFSPKTSTGTSWAPACHHIKPYLWFLLPVFVRDVMPCLHSSINIISQVPKSHPKPYPLHASMSHCHYMCNCKSWRAFMWRQDAGPS